MGACPRNHLYLLGNFANIGRPHGPAVRRQVMMGAPSRNHLYLLGAQVVNRSCPRNQCYRTSPCDHIAGALRVRNRKNASQLSHQLDRQHPALRVQPDLFDQRSQRLGRFACPTLLRKQLLQPHDLRPVVLRHVPVQARRPSGVGGQITSSSVFRASGGAIRSFTCDPDTEFGIASCSFCIRGRSAPAPPRPPQAGLG